MTPVAVAPALAVDPVLSAEGEDAVAARRLEIFLDRVAMVATRERVGDASYFLDERYDDAFSSAADRKLRAALEGLAESADVRESVAWTAVRRLSVDLGWSGDRRRSR